MLCFPLLDIRRQFAATIGFQFLYHVRTNLGNQAKDVFSGEGFKTLPIHLSLIHILMGSVSGSRGFSSS